MSMLDELKRVEQELNETIKKVSSYSPRIRSQDTTAIYKAIQAARPVIVTMIKNNFSSAGLKSNTGKLMDAIGSIIVLYRKGRAVIQMPTMVSQYEYKSKRTGKVTSKSNPYAVWNALEYGSVTVQKETRTVIDLPTMRSTVKTADVIGSKAKRTIKKQFIGGGASSRALERIEKGSKWGSRTPYAGQVKQAGYKIGTATQSRSGQSIHLSGGAVIRRPKPFFRLSKAQWATVEKIIADSLKRSYNAAQK